MRFSLVSRHHVQEDDSIRYLSERPRCGYPRGRLLRNRVTRHNPVLEVQALKFEGSFKNGIMRRRWIEPATLSQS